MTAVVKESVMVGKKGRVERSGRAKPSGNAGRRGQKEMLVDPVELLQLQNISEGLSTVHLSLCGSL